MEQVVDSNIKENWVTSLGVWKLCTHGIESTIAESLAEKMNAWNGSLRETDLFIWIHNGDER